MPFASLLTRRRSAWGVILAMLLLAAAVLRLDGGAQGGAPDVLPDTAESARAQQALDTFPGSDAVPAIVVVTRKDGQALGRGDLQGLSQLATRLGEVAGGPASPAIPSEDGRAALVQVSVPAGELEKDDATVVPELREAAAQVLPDGLTAGVTGPAGFAHDTSQAFAGADVRLLAVTAAVVALLLLLTYRSPVLWLVPLITVGLADRVAAVGLDAAAARWGLAFDSSTAGITSVLVFGAGTNYALLLVSRYREELRRTEDHREALRRALAAAAPAIVASNVTVVLALGVLLLGALPSSRALGLASGVGLLVALLFSLTLLPALLSVCGRRLFWPFVPRAGEASPTEAGLWHRIASAVTRRPVPALLASFAALALLASGLLGASLGLKQTDQLTTRPESVTAYEALAEHFPAGASSPLTVIAAAPAAEKVTAAVKGVEGVTAVRPLGTNGDGPGALVQLAATTDAAPATQESYEIVRAVREAAHGVEGADALVGGSVAELLDQREGTVHDMRLAFPLILLVVLAVLIVLLRALVAPVVLLATNVVSALAAMGLGTWVSTHLLGFDALDTSVPLYAFLFLVALGIDYTIFLVVRTREETRDAPTREAVTRAVSATGGVITSAGIVLAAVFVVLGVLPVVTLTQVGVIVCLGVLLDTFLVRTVVVPALFAVIGERMWWPGRPARS